MDILRSAAEREKHRIDALVSEVGALVTTLQNEEEQWKRENKLVPLDWKGKVKLDVGGKKFFTTMPVLFAKKGFFRALSEGVGNVKKDSEGCLFIDRSPAVFKHILNYMSDQPLPSEFTPHDLELLLIESEFYELGELAEILGQTATQAQPTHNPPNIKANASMWDIANSMKADVEERRAAFVQQKGDYGRLLSKIISCVSTEKVRLQLQEEAHVFSTTLATLTRKPGVLQAKFSRQWDGDVDEDGSVFINKDGTTFDVILNLLRGYPMPSHLSKHECESLTSDLDYFGLVGQFEPPKPPDAAIDSVILKPLSNGAAFLKALQSWLPDKKIGTCLYRGSRDGMDAPTFHQKCDGKPATLVLIRSSNGYLFGGLQ